MHAWGRSSGAWNARESRLRDMRDIFWLSLALIVYAYAGYPVLLMAVARFKRLQVRKEEVLPTVSIVMAVRNEGLRLRRKLDNLRQLEYPPHLLQIVIASDGSTDDTEDILHLERDQVETVMLKESVGKAAALNAAVRHATGEILVFLDARQRVDLRALRELTANFADAGVGAVSGELLLEEESGAPAADAVGLYWKIEKMVRRLESASGSVVGVTGAIYAIRRELFEELPPGLLLDDVLVPMRIARRGRRVVFEPKAIARDTIFSERGREFSRKVRTLTGNYQLVQRAPWILSAKNPLLFRFVSHKLMRLAVPILLLVCLISSILADGFFYKAMLMGQVVLYCLALLGSVVPSSRRFKPVAIVSTFVMLNAAAAMALYNFVAGKDEVWA